MSIRLDHVVLATLDLDEVSRRYRDLGFIVEQGGRHPGKGTRNALIRLTAGYLEWLEVHDAAEARAAGPTGTALTEYLAMVPDGFATYAVSMEVDAARAAFDGHGVAYVGPKSASRERPDGTILRWRTVVPGGTTVRTALPFIIEWEGPSPGSGAGPDHPNGAQRIERLRIAVPDLSAVEPYRWLGARIEVAGTSSATAWLGDVGVELVVDPAVAPGPIDLDVVVGDGDRLVRTLDAAGIGHVRSGDSVFVEPADPTTSLLRFRLPEGDAG
jgi:hypothetical protein